MSRIGNAPVTIPDGVTVTVEKNNVVTVKGKLGTLTQALDARVTPVVEGKEVLVKRNADDKQSRAMHGLYRALINNMVEGVSKGYTIEQELVGVGYRAANKGQLLELSLGFSHNIVFEIPKEIVLKTETLKGQNPKITLTSFDKQLIGQVAAKIRSLRKPEPYKGKGIKFTGEELRRKAGKAAGK
ncbi:MAG: 50S ribosomal protein L6 [Flavobacteriales bacterium]